MPGCYLMSGTVSQQIIERRDIRENGNTDARGFQS
jgi:hypothetical protein